MQCRSRSLRLSQLSETFTSPVPAPFSSRRLTISGGAGVGAGGGATAPGTAGSGGAAATGGGASGGHGSTSDPPPAAAPGAGADAASRPSPRPHAARQPTAPSNPNARIFLTPADPIMAAVPRPRG